MQITNIEELASHDRKQDNNFWVWNCTLFITNWKKILCYFIVDDLITFAGLKNLRASLRVSQAGGLSSSVSAAGCSTERGCRSLKAWTQLCLKDQQGKFSFQKTFFPNVHIKKEQTRDSHLNSTTTVCSNFRITIVLFCNGLFCIGK